MGAPSDSARIVTKAESVVVFIVVSAIMGFSYFTAHHAAANTPADPAFRHLVSPESTKLLFKTDYLYVPLLFQFVAWLAVATSLLPAPIQERWLLNTQPWTRTRLYFLLAFSLLVSAGIYSHASNALSAAAATVSSHYPVPPQRPNS